MPNSNKKKRPWEEEKERLLKMSQEERRQELDREYILLQDIPTWLQQYGDTPADDYSQKINTLCDKVSLYKGDITQLEVDAIVNAANSSLLGGGGVDGCIHRASGPNLMAECRALLGCPTGQAKMTCGYLLPAKYVIHTVGPIARGHLSDNHKKDLESCYKSSLALAKEKKIRSIAFPCISTGIYGFPNEPAACIALNTAKEWLTENQDEIDRIIFCVFLEIDDKIYKKKLAEFFPKELEEKNVNSPPSKKSKAKKEQSTNLDDPDDTKDSDHEPDISDDMTEPSKEPEANKKESVLESAEDSRDIEEPHQHSDGDPMKDVDKDQEPSVPSNLSQTDQCMPDPSQEEEVKTSHGGSDPSQDMNIDSQQEEDKSMQEESDLSQETNTYSQSESVCMESQEFQTPQANEHKEESQAQEQSSDTQNTEPLEARDDEMNSQNSVPSNDENSQRIEDMEPRNSEK